MNQKINVILICGGKSTEHEVSIKSARSIYQALDKEKYNVIPIGITKTGSWVKGDSVLASLESGNPIKELPERAGTRPAPTLNTKHLTFNSKQLTVVFPILHGPLGEDGTIQGLFEMANLAYVGSGVLASALGMDKVKQKEIFKSYNLPVVDFTFFWKKDWDENQEKVLKQLSTHFNDFYPLFIKPANAGSSVGVTKAHNLEELIAGIKKALDFDIKIIVEKGLENIREIEVAVIGNYSPETSVCGEIIPGHEFYDYEDKYLDGKSKAEIPAQIDPKIAKEIQESAKQAFLSLDCRGFARVDFFLEGNRFWLNEINTIPGFTEISMFPKLMEYSGLSYPELVEKLINLTLERWGEKQTIKTSVSFPPQTLLK